MALTRFVVVHARANEMTYGDPLIHCDDGKQLVLTFIAREALDDYFRVPGDEQRTLAQWNLVVERNLASFAKIIVKKYEADEWEVFNSQGQSYPRITVTLQDMQSSGEHFSDEVLKIKPGYARR